MKKAFVASFVALSLALGATAEDKPGKPGKPEGKPGAKRPGGFQGGGQLMGKMFEKADANGDGKISKDELSKAFANAPMGRLKDNPQIIDKMFERLDANKDGVLSKEEMQKAGGQLQGRGPGGKPGAKKPEKK